MARARDESTLRGAITAAATVLGVPLELVDGDEWSVTSGRVHVGLGYLTGARESTGQANDVAGAPVVDVDAAVARTIVLLWESAREVRVAPLRRERRLALSRQRPELEPILACLDRLLAATEVIAVFPSLRVDVARVLAAQLPEEAWSMPRHLQWIGLLLTTAIDPRRGAELRASLTPEVLAEYTELEKLGGPDVNVLRLALSADPSRSAMQRFERAYAVIAPPYEKLLERDAAERGLDAGGAMHGGSNDEADSEIGAGTSGGSSDDAKPGGDADDAASDGAGESARAGDVRDSSEGADLFAAEQAGFVQTVLSTPLPADGDWPDGLEPPDIEATKGSTGARSARNGGGGNSASTASTSLVEYRGRAGALAASIEQLRDVWRSVIAERVAARAVISRRPEADGEILDRDSLVRIVSEVVAGVERPRAFLARERQLRRSTRAGSTDYVLLIDRSASMQGAPAEAAADAALIMLESLAAVERDIAAEERALGIDLGLSLRTALIVFDSMPTVVKPLSGSLDDEVRRRMHAEIRSPRGSTNDAAALAAASREFGIGGAGRSASDGRERRRVMILVSDGGTDDGGSAAREIRALRAAGVAVFGVGIRTADLVSRFAPSGSRLDDPGLLAAEIGRLVSGARLDTEKRSR